MSRPAAFSTNSTESDISNLFGVYKPKNNNSNNKMNNNQQNNGYNNNISPQQQWQQQQQRQSQLMMHQRQQQQNALNNMTPQQRQMYMQQQQQMYLQQQRQQQMMMQRQLSNQRLSSNNLTQQQQQQLYLQQQRQQQHRMSQQNSNQLNKPTPMVSNVVQTSDEDTSDDDDEPETEVETEAETEVETDVDEAPPPPSKPKNNSNNSNNVFNSSAPPGMGNIGSIKLNSNNTGSPKVSASQFKPVNNPYAKDVSHIYGNVNATKAAPMQSPFGQKNDNNKPTVPNVSSPKVAVSQFKPVNNPYAKDVSHIYGNMETKNAAPMKSPFGNNKTKMDNTPIAANKGVTINAPIKSSILLYIIYCVAQVY